MIIQKIRTFLFILFFLGFVINNGFSQWECAEEKNVSVMIVLDNSSSIGASLNTVRNFGLDLIEELENETNLTDVGYKFFCGGVTGTIGWDPNTTRNRLNNELNCLCGTVCDYDLNGNPIYIWNLNDGTWLNAAISSGASDLRTRNTSNIRLLVVLTDGVDDGTSSVSEYSAASAIAGTDIVTRLVFFGSSGPGLGALSSISRSPEQVIASTNLTSLINQIVDATCPNYKPKADIDLSDTNLKLGIDGFDININGSGSSDKEDSDNRLDFRWTFTRPDGSTFSRDEIGFSSFTQTFNDDFLSSGTNWQVRLRVIDRDGAEHTDSESFTVSGSPPNISIDGPSEIDALQTLSIECKNTIGSNPTQDVDGGALTFEWIVEDGPSGGSIPIGETATTNAFSFPAMTTENDITTVDGADIKTPWTFTCRVTDDEGDMDEETKIVRVNNLPPKINIIGINEIDIGEELRVETDILTDDDGGDLIFSWDMIQVPDNSGVGLVSGFSTTEVLSFFTDDNDAGTWIVRINAEDNEGQIVSEDFKLLVDAPPVADISGPDNIGSLSFPLVLDGNGSIDPDTDNPHSNAEGEAELSSGIVSYSWYLIDFPGEYSGEYYSGRIDEVFGVSASGPSMSLNFGELNPVIGHFN